jgi:hypothetical protein
MSPEQQRKSAAWLELQAVPLATVPFTIQYYFLETNVTFSDFGF